MSQIGENIKAIQQQKAEAARRAGRDPEDILLVAVTKTYGPEAMNQAIEAGITDIGESKVQEILDKFDSVLPVRWHMIGHLQTNKVKYIIDKVAMIHSVDSLKLAKEIDRRAAQHGLTMDILLQVNAAEEESKFGVSMEDTEGLLQQILAECPNLRIKGLMHIAPAADDPEDVRVWFREVKKLYDKLGAAQHPNLDFHWLSMGMSHDFPVAVEEGSNMIRVGTAIFGQRYYPEKN
ncbi:MAG: YggS family pyridoxal phosphate-dependent enzyme [Clostridiales bacterium]|nr:YggS family pyridoxal phosphate-dependent enzyme [Clostridiales bacterium]